LVRIIVLVGGGYGGGGIEGLFVSRVVFLFLFCADEFDFAVDVGDVGVERFASAEYADD